MPINFVLKQQPAANAEAPAPQPAAAPVAVKQEQHDAKPTAGPPVADIVADIAAENMARMHQENADAESAATVDGRDRLPLKSDSEAYRTTTDVYSHETNQDLQKSKTYLLLWRAGLWMAAERAATYRVCIYLVSVAVLAAFSAIDILPDWLSYMVAFLLWLSFELNTVALGDWLGSFWNTSYAVVALLTTKRSILKGLLKSQFAIVGNTDDKRNYDLWLEKHQQRVRARLRSFILLVSGAMAAAAVNFCVSQYNAQCPKHGSDGAAVGCYSGEICTYDSAHCNMQQQTAGLTELATHGISTLITQASHAFWRMVSTAALVVIYSCWKDFAIFIFADEPKRAELFEKRLNISLNAITGGNQSPSSRTFHMRTINELAIQEFLPGLEAHNILERAMNYAIDQQKHGGDDIA